jgi:hypothetical protein
MNRVSSPSVPSIDHLQVLVQSRSITASNSIPELTRSPFPSVCPKWLHSGLLVCIIMISKCISKIAWSRPASEFEDALQSASTNSLNYNLRVQFLVHSIRASTFTSKYTELVPENFISQDIRSRPRSVTLSSFELQIQMLHQLLSSTICSPSRYTVCRLVAI